MKKIAAVALLSAVFTAPASADDSRTYLGLRLGNNDAGGALGKPSDTSFGLLSGYRYNRNFAVEGKYLDPGQFSAASAVADTDTWGLNAIGLLPLNNSFSLYGKLGAARTNASASAAAGAARRTTTIYGLGGQYDTTPRIGIRFGWDRHGMGVTGQNADDDLYSLTAVFKF